MLQKRQGKLMLQKVKIAKRYVPVINKHTYSKKSDLFWGEEKQQSNLSLRGGTTKQSRTLHPCDCHASLAMTMVFISRYKFFIIIPGAVRFVMHARG